jgi:NCS1 family nucleobase:cation symporter-1
VPIVLNGAIGSELHVPFPIAARASFGYYFSKVAVIIRMITALFWHSIQTYAGSTAMIQVIRAIWPSFRNVPNHLPESAGITTQQMVAHFIFWSVQLPFLLQRPHKLRWFFVFKVIFVLAAAVGTVIGMCVKAGGSGDLWHQETDIRGTKRSWLILAYMSSMTGGWATMATNIRTLFESSSPDSLGYRPADLPHGHLIADYTRYMRKASGQYWQALLVPLIATFIGLLGLISTSAAKVVYSEYIWDPVSLADRWEGPGGRAAAFFVGLAWCVAQIGVNLSANVISCSNDMTGLFPRYINIRRGAVITTIIGGWIMVSMRAASIVICPSPRA